MGRGLGWRGLGLGWAAARGQGAAGARGRQGAGGEAGHEAIEAPESHGDVTVEGVGVGGDEAVAETGGDEGLQGTQNGGHALRGARVARSGRVGAAFMLPEMTFRRIRFKENPPIGRDFSCIWQR